MSSTALAGRLLLLLGGCIRLLLLLRWRILLLLLVWRVRLLLLVRLRCVRLLLLLGRHVLLPRRHGCASHSPVNWRE